MLNVESIFLLAYVAAGTYLCELAVANGHRAAGIRALGLKDYGFNCNILGDDPGHLGLGVNGQESKYGQAEGKLSCDGRLALMEKMQIDFSAAERWLWPQEICIQKFIYMTCFRDPISRIKSSLRFHRLQQPKVVMSWAESNSFNPASPISNGSPTVDNFYIRSLSGKSVYTKHLGQITTADLERAKNVLSLFEVVIILEKLSTRDVVQLATRLQWSKTSLSFTPKKTGRTTVRALSSEQEKRLRQLNALDQEFYQHADRQAAEISAKCSQNALNI